MSDNLKANEYNFIASIYDLNHAYSLSYADATTGEVYATLISHNPAKVVSEIVNLGVKEVVITSKVDRNIYTMLKNQFHLTVTITDETTEDYNKIMENIDFRYQVSVKHLLAYIAGNQKRNLGHLQKVEIRENKDYLRMDVHTKRNLELTETLRQHERSYSLIWLLDKTKTAMGGRFLKTYILNPLLDKNKIEKRYDMVDTLLEEFLLKSDLENYLKDIYDLEMNNLGSTVECKIGLMYVSDYNYGSMVSNWNDYNLISNNNWLNIGIDNWLLTRNSGDNNSNYYINSSGIVSSATVEQTYFIRPVFYLDSTISITGGNGLETNPYRIGG